MTSRSYVFTLNNPTPEELSVLKMGTFAKHGANEVTYCCWQLEKESCVHVQGYAEFKRSARRAAVKAMLRSDRVHVQKRDGTQAQARDYTGNPDAKEPSKSTGKFGYEKRASEEVHVEFGVERKWFEHGVFVEHNPGKRTDIQTVTDRIRGGATPDDIADEFPQIFMRMERGIRGLYEALQRKRGKGFRKVRVIVHYGPTGVGKTRSVYAEHDPEHDGKVFKLTAQANGSSLWLDNYEGQDILLIDDFKAWIKITELLTLLDGYPLDCARKGGFVRARWTKVYITSNLHPKDWYKNVSTQHLRALSRRLNKIKRFEKEEEEDSMEYSPSVEWKDDE